MIFLLFPKLSMVSSGLNPNSLTKTVRKSSFSTHCSIALVVLWWFFRDPSSTMLRCVILIVSMFNAQPTDQGMYSCHLHHHYCGLHERRQFQVTVEPPVIQTTQSAKAAPSGDKGNKQTHTHKYTHSVFLPVLVMLEFCMSSFTDRLVCNTGQLPCVRAEKINSHLFFHSFFLVWPHSMLPCFVSPWEK